MKPLVSLFMLITTLAGLVAACGAIQPVAAPTPLLSKLHHPDRLTLASNLSGGRDRLIRRVLSLEGEYNA
jgi:hypothetical protein